MAPSHGLREAINETREPSARRNGARHCHDRRTARLARVRERREDARRDYSPGDLVTFHRPCKRLGVDNGDELRVARVDHGSRSVNLEGADGRSVVWEPNQIAARAAGVEVYRSEDFELRARDRIRWTRNDAGLGLVNSGTAEVAAVRGSRRSKRSSRSAREGREAGLEASRGRVSEREIAGSRQREQGLALEPSRAPKAADRDLGL